MGFLDSLTTYASGYQEIGSEKLTASEIKTIDHIEVVEKEQEWGTSVSFCFYMKSGGRKYVPMSRDCVKEVGDVIDPKKVIIKELQRDGEDPIYRADTI